MVRTECDEKLGGFAGCDGQQLGERLLRAVRESGGHRLVDGRDQRAAPARLHGGAHLRLHHWQTVPQLQVRHNDDICVRCRRAENIWVPFHQVWRQILVRRLRLAILFHNRTGS